PTGQFGVGPPRYRRLDVEYAENVLDQPGIVQVTLPAYGRLLVWDFDPEEEGTSDYPPLVEDGTIASRIVTWLRIRLPNAADPSAGATDRPQQQARLSWVGVNAARVIQALRVENERLGVGTGAPDQAYKVANPLVILEAPAAGPSGGPATPTLVVEVQNASNGWDTWQPTDDLFAAGPNDQVYAVDPEAGQVSFGDGLRGLRPPLGRLIRASYEYGGGPAGQVAIGAINKSPALPGGFKVENPVPTWGAAAGEDVAAGERNVPRYLRHRDRVVTASDFRDIVLRTPGVDVGRVEILPLFNPDRFDATDPTATWPGTVTVLVIPRSDPNQPDAPVPDRLFLRAVCDWIDPRRLVTTEVYVRGPIYVPLWVSVGIVTLPGHLRELVQQDVRAALREYLSPLVGGPPVLVASTDAACGEAAAVAADPCPTLRGLGWQLGTEVRRQDLEAAATRVPGVRYVDSIRLGVRAADGTTLTDVATVRLAGLQLPRLVGISVGEGPAEDLASILGQQPLPPAAQNQVPVPVLPKKC
ncbi:MAG TPA: baseplate J/gp47 family protein, partial [Candidatus Dormibacteraeota bacterium]